VPPRLRVGPLLPKLRRQLAEFLHEGSLARLSLLSSPTCVGLRYGPSSAPAGLFSAPAPIRRAPKGSPTCWRADGGRGVPRRSAPETGHGISTVCPSPTPPGLGLGPTNLGRTNLAQEPLGFRRGGFSPPCSLLIPAFALVRCPPVLPVRLHPNGRRSPTPRSRRTAVTASVATLSPVHCRRTCTRPVSYYALFQGWLLLSQPPGCLRTHTALPT